MLSKTLPDRIALIGDFGTGKTSIADAWVDITHGKRISFAAALKWEVAFALAGSDTYLQAPDGLAVILPKRAFEHYERMANVDTKDSYRRILQLWGTEFRRAQDPNYWVRQTLDTINTQTGPIAIDDCRFDNEHDALVAAGFTFVILDPGPTARDQGELAAAHASEQDWKRWPGLHLSFEPGPAHQAQRLIEAGLDGTPPAPTT